MPRDHSAIAEKARDVGQPGAVALSFFLVTSLDYGVTRRLNFGLTTD